jgi:two-component system sensor histidine kinase BaeS
MQRGPRGLFAPQTAWIWLLLLGLIIVPPLFVWVLRPLREMVAVAGRLAAGDLETPVTIDRRDEFGELEGAFEHLRVALRRSLQQREQLLTDVSHEIRAPLARMMIALPLLRCEGASGPVTQIFEHELRAVDALVGEVLALARGGFQELLARETVDLAAIAAQLAADRAPFAAQKGLALTVAGTAAPVIGDAKLLTRAIGNLLDNALTYTDAGASVQIETGVEAGEAFARVADTGPGIDAEALPHVFEPFWRPDTSRSRETGGAGLGLSIVRRVAQSHGGTATVVSPAGGGTIAELRLPSAHLV